MKEKPEEKKWYQHCNGCLKGSEEYFDICPECGKDQDTPYDEWMEKKKKEQGE